MSAKQSRTQLAQLLSASLLCALLSACAVGPDFKTPDAPAVDRYTAQPLSSSAADADADAANPAQQLVAGQDIPAQWWNIFHCEPLNALISTALRNNPDLHAADAALRIATENSAAQRGTYFPAVQFDLMPTRQNVTESLASPETDGNSLYNLHTAQLSISYALDIFGGNRRLEESLQAQQEQQQFQREAAYLTLSSNLVLAAIQEASLRAQIDATMRMIAAAAKQRDMLHQLRNAGMIGAADIAAQDSVLAQAQSNLPPLEKQLAQQRNLLTVLSGALPSQAMEQRFELSALQLPAALPLSLPSQLVRQRPDIRAAEAQWHAAGALVGVALANRLPSLSLTATIGSGALNWSRILSADTGFWNLGADLGQPIFNGGMLMHRQRAAEAAYAQAGAQYRSTVLSAFQNVADTLQAIQSDSVALTIALAAQTAAARSLHIATQQWTLGAVNYLPVLIAQQAYQQSAVSLAQAQASRLSDSAALFQALGGGWWTQDAQPK